jgi:phenylpyruvate tautomerase PptA (4-oxalocrotonate tautomerase family)
MDGTCVIKTEFLIIDEITLLLMNILVKFQPDIHILMVMGQINPLRPQNWGTGEKQLKSGKNDDSTSDPLNLEIIMVNPQRKLYGLKH